MKVAGIIVEYNPFHKGHQYHIEETRRITGADYVVAIMSGNFTQRGIPACFDKYSRTECALAAGADLVLELPFCYATGSAEYFAEGAVSILTRLGCIDFLCFGTEGPCDASLFRKAAAFLCEEPEEYKLRLKEQLKLGNSFPVARQTAAKGLLSEEALALLSSPNALLGIEYCKALYRLNSTITPVPIHRIGSGYHDTQTDASGYSSATAIRTLLQTDAAPDHTAFFAELPESSAALLKKKAFTPVFSEDFFSLISYRIMTAPQELSRIWDVSPELLARLCARTAPSGYEDWLSKIKSKQYTRTRIERCLLHILLGLTEEDITRFRPTPGTCAGYARILGFNESSSALLKRMKETATLPVITKLAQKEKRCNPEELALLSYDILAADLYSRVVYQKYGVLLPDEYSYIVINN